MRYIGSKTNLLPDLERAISERGVTGGVFCDLFAGTGAVGRHFKKDFQIISNDLLYFSHVLQHAGIVINEEPDFSGLSKIARDPFQFLNSLDPVTFKFKAVPFIAENFSPFNDGERKYLTEVNALHVDAVRQTIDQWFETDLITQSGHKYLLASLIESVPSVSNIAGTYGAYLKHWDSRTRNPLKLKKLAIIDNKRENVSFNEDANALVRKINGDILYIDPPYNGRQYLGNYHLLETIAKYDSPVLKGKTGTREDSSKSSDYCKKGKVKQAFEDLISAAEFENIFLSYSTEGLISESELVEIVSDVTNSKRLKVHRIPYRRYSRVKDENKPLIHELIISAVK